ncbi:hypothetical protein A9239_00245 [Methanosarcina sp. A14]|nr:hypothetical protein A9239_00245 [Methanosarcina sp. A14]
MPFSSSNDGFTLKSHPHQLLKDHLEGVTIIATDIYASQNKNGGKQDIIRKICMAHDFGKATSFFQEYLAYHEAKEKGEYRGKDQHFGPNKNHSLLSAIFAYWWLPEEYKLFGYLIVKRHHGSVKDARDEFNLTDNYNIIEEQIRDIKKYSQIELEKIYDLDLNDFFEFINERDIKKIKKHFRSRWQLNKFSIEDTLDFNYVYSLLLTADKMQLISESPKLPAQKPSWFVEKYKDHIRFNLLSKNEAIADSQIFQMRDEIFEEIKKELALVDLNSDYFFSINVPTGSGKTFLAYYSALYLADKLERLYGNESRVIYSLPYMSIIDQNYDELLNIIKFNQGNEEPKDTEILKHHSLSEIKYESDEKEYKNYDARFCYDNWQSKIITTTFVQLFNTVFKLGNNSIAHRFHRLTNSIIILDEIQAVDEKYYPVIRKFFELLARKYNTRFIFVTATMPFLVGTHELVPGKKTYFEKLNRIKICNHIHEEESLDEFKNILLEDIEDREEKSFLIVLNTIKSSKEIFEFLQENTGRTCLYLSTEIYPKARLEKINFIKNSPEKLVVVSTQLIEAGVDIDLDVVYRDFSPLSSINQTAGRANRNGVGQEPGEVHVYRLKHEKTDAYFHNYIYPVFLTDITLDILENKEVIQEKEIYFLNETYAKKIIEKVSHDISKEMLEDVENFDLRKLRDSFELIKKDYAFKRDIIIEADPECSQIIEKLRDIKKKEKASKNPWEYSFEIKNLFRQLNQYRISINEKTYSEIRDDLQEIKGFDVEYLPMTRGTRQLYSEDKGIISDTQSIEIF